MFSNTVGSHINGQVKNLVVPLTKRIDKKQYRDTIYDVLRTLEENGVLKYQYLRVLKLTKQ